MRDDSIKTLLDDKESWRHLLFPRGFLLTDHTQIDPDQYPFYGLWKKVLVQGYCALVHPKQKIYISEGNGLAFVLVGHAFNPVSLEQEYRETQMLDKARLLYHADPEAFERYFNQWTGQFALFVLEQNTLRIYGDAAGMYTVFYGSHNGKVFCASHTNMLGDICDIQFDEYVQRLVAYRFYPLLGASLPGDISPYSEFVRLIPNHYAQHKEGKWQISRFFPKQGITLLDAPYEELIDRAAQILSSSMMLIPKKWNRASISLTGGCDSKTTLSCAKDVYDKYSYFSYISSDSEAVDAFAASEICQKLNLPHKIYEISERDEDYQDIEAVRKLMEYNYGSIGKTNRNDVRKRAFFLGLDDFDVEVKSWVSEVARGYYHKRFAKKRFPPKLTPRYATCLYKVFVANRKLIRDTDKIFERYIGKYFSDEVFDIIPWYDLLFWEFRMSSWNGLVITGEHQITYDIVIPYNNRELLWLLLSTPIQKRVEDQPHKDIMKKMNQSVSECGISVVNVKHTQKRARMERLYLTVASKIPF